jgi:hypothetical protein
MPTDMSKQHLQTPKDHWTLAGWSTHTLAKERFHLKEVQEVRSKVDPSCPSKQVLLNTFKNHASITCINLTTIAIFSTWKKSDMKPMT